MSKDDREVVADWLMLAGGLLLFLSLFLTWSHQRPPVYRAMFGTADALRNIPSDPTGWQVYSAADVLMAVLALGLIGVALIGPRPARVIALLAAAAGLVFALHALADPPANGGANVFNPALNVPQYLPFSPAAGVGETVAILALLLAIAGLVLSFTAD